MTRHHRRQPRARSLAALVVAASLTACVSAPSRTRPDTDVSLPADWTAGSEGAAASAPAAARWWKAFEAPGLGAAIERALERNTDLRVAEARLRQAEAGARIAGADLGPSVGLAASGSRRKQNFIGFPIPGSDRSVLSTTSTNLGVSLQTSWELDLWGRIGATGRQARADAQASRADLAGARLSVAGQVAKAWFGAVEALQQVRLAEATVASFRSSADQVRDRFERGLRPSLDLRLALANLAGAEALLQQRRRQRDATLRQIEVLLGDYPAAALETASSLPAVPEPPPAGLPSELVARRPDLVAAERRLVASDQGYAAARASLYPRIALTASGGTSSDRLQDLVDGDFSVWSLVGNLVQPLFEGGRLRAGVDLAAAGLDQRLAEYVGTALRAYAEVETALAAEAFLADRVHRLHEAAEQADAAQRLAEDRYRNGLEDYITVLEAQRRALAARSELLAGRRARLDNRVDLHLALGGGLDATTILATDHDAGTPPFEESAQ